VEEIKKILIVGSGTMGQQIGFVCAMRGYDVTLYDLTEELLVKAMAGIRKMADGYGKAGRLSQTEADAVINRISLSNNPKKAGRDADFMKRYIDQGRLGEKSERGFYEYPDPEYRKPDFKTSKNRLPTLQRRGFPAVGPSEGGACGFKHPDVRNRGMKRGI
jgi:3-hydroxyacyl-CoA dehydrogenase